MAVIFIIIIISSIILTITLLSSSRRVHYSCCSFTLLLRVCLFYYFIRWLCRSYSHSCCSSCRFNGQQHPSFQVASQSGFVFDSYRCYYCSPAQVHATTWHVAPVLLLRGLISRGAVRCLVDCGLVDGWPRDRSLLPGRIHAPLSSPPGGVAIDLALRFRST